MQDKWDLPKLEKENQEPVSWHSTRLLVNAKIKFGPCEQLYLYSKDLKHAIFKIL